MVFLLTLTYGPILSLLALYGVERGLGNVGVFFTVYAIVLTTTRPLSGRLADGWGFEPTAAVGLVFVAAGLLTLASAHGLVVLLAAAALYGVGFGTTQPSLQAIVMCRVVPARRGAATATFLIAYDLGLAVGSVVAGFLAGVLTLGGVFAFSASLAVLAIVLLLAHMRRKARSLSA
jgi:MFS family permease